MSASEKSVLLVAFHFPPLSGSTGIQRTLRFAEHLPRFGWHPVILTINPWAYESKSESMGNEALEGVPIYRAFGLDAARHLSLFGRYPRALAVPDRWASWRLRAVPMALKIIKRHRINVIWSTFPIATAHWIGLHVSLRSGLPWVAEFRDPMWQGDYPSDPAVNRSWLMLEQQVFREAKAVVVTTPGAAALYRERYPDFDSANIRVIENGYDERSFQRAEAGIGAAGIERTAAPVTLLHSGLIYLTERDPTQLFAAIGTLKAKGVVDAGRLRIVMRASGNDQVLGRHIATLGIDDIVHLQPAVDYVSALREMMDVDGLLILQASNCNAQIPAKIYEYFRARRPILALTDPRGDTARTLETACTGLVVPLNSQTAIEAAIVRFVTELKDNSWKRMSDADVLRYSREAQTGTFAELLDSLCSSVVSGH